MSLNFSKTTDFEHLNKVLVCQKQQTPDVHVQTCVQLEFLLEAYTTFLASNSPYPNEQRDRVDSARQRGYFTNVNSKKCLRLLTASLLHPPSWLMYNRQMDFSNSEDLLTGGGPFPGFGWNSATLSHANAAYHQVSMALIFRILKRQVTKASVIKSDAFLT